MSNSFSFNILMAIIFLTYGNIAVALIIIEKLSYGN